MLDDEDRVTDIQIEHTWVEAYVPYTNYRGAGSATGDYMWIPLDTGIKKYRDNESVYEFVAEQDTTDSKELLALAMERADELYVTNRSIEKEELPYLPLSLQYEVVGEVTRSSEIDESICDAISFTLSEAGNVTLKSYETYNRRITLDYKPVSTGTVRAELCLDGEVLLTGSEVPEGYEETFTMHVKSGGRTSTVTNPVYAGGLYQITVDMQNITAREISEAYEELVAVSSTVTEENVCTDGYLGVLLDYAGKMYFAQVDIENSIMGEQLNLTGSRDLSVGMTGYRVTTVTMNGVLCGIEGGSLYIDIDHNVYRVQSNTGDSEAVRKYMLATGMMSSALESSIWEQITGAPSFSTMSLMQEAIEMDTEIVMLTKANWEEEKDYLELSAETMADIESRINSGKAVIVPVTEQTIGEWTGSGYMVLDMETYVGEYMISGGLNGGINDAAVGIALLVNLILASVDIVETASLVPSILNLFAMGGLVGVLGGSMILLFTTIIYVAVIDDVKTNVDLWCAYLNGDDAAGDQLVENMALNILFTGMLTLITKAIRVYADDVIRANTAKYIDDAVGEPVGESFMKNVKDPAGVNKAVKALDNGGVSKGAIKKAVTELTEDELIRIGNLQKKGLQSRYVQELIDNPSLLAKYTDDDILGKTDVIFGNGVVPECSIVPSSAKISPSMQKGSKPSGNYAKEINEQFKKQNETADLFASEGYDIKMLDEVAGGNGYGIFEGSNPDFLIEGKVFDCYTPGRTTAVNTIIHEMSNKTKKQAPNIVLNLDLYEGNTGELLEIITRKANSNGDLKRLEELWLVMNGNLMYVFE